AGNLGRAILNYKILNKFGFYIEYVFDNNKSIIGKKISGKEIIDVSNLKNIIKNKMLKVAILAVNPDAAQSVTNLLAESGIKVVINYTSVPVKAPKNVSIQTTDPIEILLHTLYYLSRTGQAY
ncbi:MAG: hypothetical protein PHR39_05160, partial [Actinomycetota bacterium]|nr:hypothetical protein [Actinomycetota bacterium]